MQANEEWLVLPGIVSAFILNDLLKKEGFSAFAKDKVKANEITEESSKVSEVLAATETQMKLEEEAVMNVEAAPVLVVTEKICGGARCRSNELNGGEFGGKCEVEEEGGHCGGCGGGCGGGGRCGGGGGRCGGMTKITDCDAGTCTGGSTGCGNCGTTNCGAGACGNTMKSNANESAPSVEAPNYAVSA